MQLDSSQSPRLIHEELGIDVESEEKFCFAVFLSEANLIGLFLDGWSGELDYVGKFITVSGEVVQTIPFPPNLIDNRQYSFNGAQASKNGVKIYFNVQNDRDCWGEYSIDENLYVAFHESR